MRKGIIVISLIFFITASLLAQEIKFPEIKDFKLYTDYPVYVPDNLWDFIDGAADTYLALGFVDLHVAEYKKGKKVIKLEIYKHSDHTMAFGIYASERSPSFRFLDLGAQGYIAEGAINFFKGNYYIKIRTHSIEEKIIRAEESLAVKIAGMLEGESEMPELLIQFPSDGRKQNEETFINENVLGHSFLSKAFKAQYETGSVNYSVYILQKDTQEESRKMVEKYLAFSGINPVEGGNNKHVLTDGYNGTIFLAWKENQVVLIQGLTEDQAEIAEKYFSEILNQKR